MHRIEYTFLHRDIIERFIVRTAQFCKEKEYWRNGVFIEYQNSFAIVEAIKEEKTIHIECFGQGKGLLLQKIREEFDKICPLEKAKEYQIVNGETRPFNDEMPRQHDTKKGGLSDEAFEKTLSVKIENATNTALENIPLFKNNYTSNSMTTEHLKDQVRSLISKAKTKGAMDLVATWAHENNQEQLKSDIALLKGDFTDLSREKTLGLLGNSEANTRQNQLNNKVLSLVNNVEIPIKKEEQDTTSKIDNSMIKNTLSGKSLNIFLSYSHKDEELKEQLDTHLAALKRNNLIQTWNDRAILTGEEWDIAIKTQLAQADIILLLVSANFIASEYIWKVEITQAMKRHDNKEVVVVPVFIKPCDWKGMPFEKLQGLPKDAIPVTKHNDRDEVLMTIAKSIRSLVERLTA